MKTLTEHVYIWGFFVFVLQDILKSILTLFFCQCEGSTSLNETCIHVHPKDSSFWESNTKNLNNTLW